jgi:hypothetical protein
MIPPESSGILANILQTLPEAAEAFTSPSRSFPVSPESLRVNPGLLMNLSRILPA